MRYLDIGGAIKPVKGWETLDARDGCDIKCDASEPLPIPTGTYDIVHSSHVIEHIPWWKTAATLGEWVRILKPGGALEVWTMNAAKVAQIILEAEAGGSPEIPDRWYRRNPSKNIYQWAAGRIFSYDRYEPFSWHRALMTPRYLMDCFRAAGLSAVTMLPDDARRGHNHGFVNMGVIGYKLGRTCGSDPCTAQEDSPKEEATSPAPDSTQ